MISPRVCLHITLVGGHFSGKTNNAISLGRHAPYQSPHAVRSCHAPADMNGAQLWMGSVPKELDADAISTAFVTLGAPRPTAVALRRSTYRVSGASDDAPVGFALVDFASAEDASIALETCADATFKAKARGSRDASTSDAPEEDAAVECSETEMHFTFHLRRAADTLRKRVVTSFKPAGDDVTDGNRTRDDVNLAAQLAPLDSAELRARLLALGDPVSDEDERRWRDEGGGGLARLRLVERLCAAHGEPIGGGNTHGQNAHDGNRTRDDSTRNARRRVWTKADPAIVSRPISPGAIEKMMRCLAELGSEQTVPGTKAHRRWPRSAAPDRAGVIASDRYLSLTTVSGSKRHRRKLERYRWVWDECKALLASVAGNAAANAFDGLAVTHGVRGSPHVDSMDVAPQFACSLGDFRATERSDGVGGCLCVETSFDAVTAIDTKNAIVSVDGRKVHWVDPRYEGDRWSVVWYRRGLVGGTAEPEPVVDGGVVPLWWAKRGEKSSWVHVDAVDPEVGDSEVGDPGDDGNRVKRPKRGSN